MIETEATYEFVVFGRPAPQGSKRSIGGGRVIESSRYVPAWRAAVKRAAMAERAKGKRPPIDGAVKLDLAFTLRKAANRKDGIPHIIRPDLDKLIRSTMDGLTESGIWADDSLVDAIFATKRYPQISNPVDIWTGCLVRMLA